MSQFDFPRIHVKGAFYHNPGTANNDSIDPDNSGPVTANTEMVQPVSGGMCDEKFEKWLTSLDEVLHILNGQWNIYGDMSLRFQDVTVNSIQLSTDEISTNAAAFPLIGSELTINKAFAIDVNPEGFSTTQVFCDSFSFKGSEKAVGDKKVWFSNKPRNGVTRWINWYRNVSHHGIEHSSGSAGGVSATWQMAFAINDRDTDPKQKDSNPNYLDGNLRWLYDQFPRQNARGKKLRGMIFRMNVYLCSPEISDIDLYANYFSKGIKKENPALGRMIGTFAPWFEDEMTSITLSRFLNSNKSFNNPNGKQPNPAFLAPVLAFVNKENKTVSLDLSNTFPEDGKEGEKFDMGTATLQVLCPDGQMKTIHDFKYDRASYELTGGMVDIPFDDRMLHDIEEGLLAISLDKYTEGPLLLEKELLIATDESCVYLNEESELNRNIKIRACFKGDPLKKEADIYIDQWKATPTSLQPHIPLRINRQAHTIPVDGVLDYRLATLDGPGVRVFRFFDAAISPIKLDIITDFMCCARVLPRNDYSWVPDEDVTFELIYQEIFRYYHLLLPAMNKFLPMKDETIWNNPTVAQYVLKRSHQDQWFEFDYMPRTRDLSDGRRILLHRFCNKVIERGAAKTRKKY